LLLPALLAISVPARAADITVHVTHLENHAGQIMATLYDSAKTWLDPDHPVQALATRQFDGNSATIVFHDVRPGRYAVVTLHDENGNGHMDYSLLHLPEEGYAFSDNARPFLSSPDFERAAFTVPNAGIEITIRMVYP
jgi:uncharacterized protein (DUF2141 family)